MRVEPAGENRFPCSCCNRTSLTVVGYVRRDGDPHAVYYAGWSEGHLDDGVKFLIGMGPWGDGMEAQDRLSLNLWCRLYDNGPGFTVLDPDVGRFPGAELVMGRMLSREEALGHAWIQDFYQVADRVIVDDPRIRAFLEGGPEAIGSSPPD